LTNLLITIYNIIITSIHKGTSIYSKNFLEGALVDIYRGQKLSKVEFLEVPISKKLYQEDLKMDEKKKILVVDDEKTNRNILVNILKDYRVILARDGKQALERARSATPPDLILLDIIMPKPNGFEVCESLKADNKTASIPIIFISGKRETKDIIKGFKVGGADYVVKPFQPEELLARIETHLKLETTINDLKIALSKVKTLSGLIPICSSCKSIRNDEGFWEQVEVYITDNSEAELTHSLCPSCVKKLYPDIAKKLKDKTSKR